MPESDDIALLKQFVEARSESAFSVLVERYVHLVYSTALRQTDNASHAEEITQAVFVILSQKANSLGPKTILSGWLYQTARLTAANFMRSEIRRQHREQEAYMESLLNEPATNVWQQIAPLLDDAMGRLSENDRNVVVLRFFQNKSAAEIGDALGIDPSTAQKRITRAVGRLRTFFAKRNVAHSTELISGAISANSVQAAPVGLAKAVTGVALTKGATASISTLTLVKGALKIMAWTKAKMTIVAGAVVLLAAGTTTVTVTNIQRHNDDKWDTGRVDSSILDKAPRIVKIIPSRFPNYSGWASSGDRILGIGDTADEVVLAAYGAGNTRTLFLTKSPRGKYDFIANLPSGSFEALKQEIQKRFGVAGRAETIETNVLFLKVKQPAAPGLKPTKTHDRSSSSRSLSGEYQFVNEPVSVVANFAENSFGIPVIDQTGLKGNFDVDLKWDGQNDPQHENLKRAIADQLGLELISGTAPVEMLVVEKAK